MYKSVHGGDIYSEQNNSLGKNIVDYSANVNPLGLPVSVKEAIKNSKTALIIQILYAGN
jgi:threonine-phosphate decarboxylase